MGFLDRLTGKATLEDFAADVMKTIRNSGYPNELRYEGGQILQIAGGKVVGAANPGNMFATYAAAPRGERPTLLRKFAQVILQTGRKMPEDYELAKADLRPRLWLRSGVEFERLRGVIGEGRRIDLVSVPVGEHLLATLAYDWPDTVSSIPPATLEEWGVSPFVAMEDATANLEAATGDYAVVGEGLHVFASGDSYDASRIMLIPRLEALELKGRPVAMVPNREVLFVTGEEDEEGLGMMAHLAKEGLGQGYPLTGIPLTLRDGEWVEWAPPPGHPLEREYRELRLGWLGPLYAEQKELLEGVHAKTGEEVFISTLTGVETGRGLTSYCVWGEDLESLLPVAEKVAFLQKGGEGPVALADWARVVEVAGHLLEEADDYPRRYRTKGFPDGAAIEALGLGEL
jgi:hypothetical protein